MLKRGLTFGLPLLLVSFELDAHPAAVHEHGEPEAVVSAWRCALDYLWLGFVHIVPRGIDHVLFVLSLFVATTKLKPLLVQLTAFTVAHSLTLALAVLGWVRIPASIVEPLIALSIAYVALETALFGFGSAHRALVVFAFGLLHGLGFADALGDSAVPGARLLLALGSFNLGVELGQLVVVGCAALLLAWFTREPWYARCIARPASGLIALAGLYWLVERTLFS